MTKNIINRCPSWSYGCMFYSNDIESTYNEPLLCNTLVY